LNKYELPDSVKIASILAPGVQSSGSAADFSGDSVTTGALDGFLPFPVPYKLCATSQNKTMKTESATNFLLKYTTSKKPFHLS
jgi:hypothetical protein